MDNLLTGQDKRKERDNDEDEQGDRWNKRVKSGPSNQPFDDDDQPLTAQQKALSNSLIVQKILGKVGALDLFSCRLVSPVWAREATTYLQSPRFNRFFQVKFKWVDSMQNCRHTYMGTLQDFIEENGTNLMLGLFPWSQFYLQAKHILTPTILQFFSEFGGHIRSLTLDLNLHPLEYGDYLHNALLLENLRQFWIVSKLPNLKHLTLTSTVATDLPPGVPWTTTMNQEDGRALRPLSPRPLLTCLETLDLSNCPGGRVWNRFVLDVLSRAPSLKSVEDPNLRFSESLTFARRFSMVTSLKINLNKDNLADFVKFAEARPTLKEVSWLDAGSLRGERGHWPQLVQGINLLLESSSATLTKFEGWETMTFVGQVVIPVLPLVTSITFTGTPFTVQKLLPGPALLAQVFPYLKTVGLYRLHGQIDGANPVFHAANGSTTVTTLQMSFSNYGVGVQPAVFEAIPARYPNLTSLSVDISGLEKLPEFMYAVWTSLPQLEELYFPVFKPGVRNLIGDELTGQMDAIITGLSLSDCQQLRKIQERVALDVVNSLRARPSILGLTKLKVFKIYERCSHCQGGLDPLKNIKPIVSHVSFFYGFEPMVQTQALDVFISDVYLKAPGRTFRLKPNE